MPCQEITLPGTGHAPLQIRLDLPEGPHLATALLVHAIPDPESSLILARIAGRLSAMGLAVARLSLTQQGARSAEDVTAVAKALAARNLPAGLLIGHGPAGDACISAAGRIAGIRAISLLAAMPATQSDGGIGAATRSVLDHMPGPLLILHGLRDRVVPIDSAMTLFHAAPHPKSFVTLDGADHLFQRPADADEAAGIIAGWALRHLELRPPAPPPGMPEGIVRISEADPAGFLQHVVAGPHHHALADEPLAYGGRDRGMTPYGFMAAGLGACTSMTIRMYARRKGWSLDHVRVDVSHDKMHAQDAKAGSGDRIDCFRRTIHLRGDLTEAQRKRLLEVADRCPVSRTLERASTIHTVLAG